MKRKYEKKGHPDKADLRELLARDGREHLLPLVNVFALAGGALDHIIDVIGRAAIEAVLDISAADVAGEKQPGKERKGGGAAYHGRQRGRVYLADRAVRVERPRLRSPGEGELAIPAYEALRRPAGLGERMLELLLAGLSTRSYGKAIGEMAETAGVSKSSVSRQAAEAAGERLKELAERKLDDRDYLIVYVDGIQFGGHHVLAALGVDDEGNKRILGLREGASENAVVALGLLESLVERGLDPGRARLFVLDGSKALRKASDSVDAVDLRASVNAHYYELFIKNALAAKSDSIEYSVKTSFLAFLAYRMLETDGTRIRASLDARRFTMTSRTSMR